MGSILDDRRYRILTAVALGHFLTLGIRLIVPALLPKIREDLVLDLTTSGALVTGMWLVYAIGQFPAGAVTDWIGERQILTGGIGLTMVGSIALFLSQGLVGVAGGVVLIGTGAAMLGTTRMTVISDVFEDDTEAQGILAAAGNLGSLLLPLVAGFIAVLGWRYGFIWLVPLFVLALILLVRWLPASTSDPIDGSLTDEVDEIIARTDRQELVLATVVFSLSIFVYNAVTGMYPTYLSTIKGLDGVMVPVVYAMFFLAAIVVEVLVGPLQDRFGSLRVAIGLMTVSACSLFILPAVTGIVPLLVITFLINVMAVIWPMEASRITSCLPDEVEGMAFGAVRTVYMLVGATGSIVVGALADAGLFHIALQIQGAILLIAAAALWWQW